MNYTKLLFIPNYQGRIGRIEFILRHIFAFVVFLLMWNIFYELSSLVRSHFYGSGIYAIIEILLSILMASPVPLKIIFSARGKRLHDLNYTEKKRFPFMGIVLLIKAGDLKANEFGEPPRTFSFIGSKSNSK